MAGPYTVDASVFLNAFNPGEVGHENSYRFLSELQARAIPIIVPTLILPEVGAAIRRGRGDADLGRNFALALRQLPQLVLVPLDEGMAIQALGVATQYSLRGSDAVYAAVALKFGSVLVTLDREQRDRVATALPARNPDEAISEAGW